MDHAHKIFLLWFCEKNRAISDLKKYVLHNLQTLIIIKAITCLINVLIMNTRMLIYCMAIWMS